MTAPEPCDQCRYYAWNGNMRPVNGHHPGCALRYLAPALPQWSPPTQVGASLAAGIEGPEQMTEQELGVLRRGFTAVTKRLGEIQKRMTSRERYFYAVGLKLSHKHPQSRSGPGRPGPLFQICSR